jgi:hypothetical protein
MLATLQPSLQFKEICRYATLLCPCRSTLLTSFIGTVSFLEQQHKLACDFFLVRFKRANVFTGKCFIFCEFNFWNFVLADAALPSIDLFERLAILLNNGWPVFYRFAFIWIFLCNHVYFIPNSSQTFWLVQQHNASYKWYRQL